MTSEAIVEAVQLEAKTFLRRMRGTSMAAAMEVADGRCLVVKPPLRGTRPLINEWLGSRLFRILGILTAEAHPVLVPEHLARAAWPELAPSGPMVCVGSAFPVDPGLQAIYDFLPEAFAPKLANADHLIGALAVDLWALQTRPRHTVFYRDEVFWACMICHSGLFGGASWSDPPHVAPINPVQRWVYRLAEAERHSELWLEQILSLPETNLAALFSAVPTCWLSAEIGSELASRAALLLERRQTLPELLGEALGLAA
ncbi:MAG: hypothetical protein KatS3mg004_3035 [Bryobacteraceae bacterium]|jgi:hypothetical protein|nr:MAG: hypothetical protein KatS3mg004_3035 [Bryobacteraceae bacterium]